MKAPAPSPMERSLRSDPIWKGLRGSRVAAAVSGGPDSVCLLHLLHRWLGPANVVVVHVQHRLRGRESLADQRWVERFCAERGIACRVVDAPARPFASRHRVGIEEAARTLRYRALSSVVRELGIRRILTAHTANDQAETILLRLLRGTGADGLAGILSDRPLSEITGDPADSKVRVIRPLLEIPRESILRQLRRDRIPYRTDRSNRSLRFRRNWVRHRLMPLMESVHPRLVENLTGLAWQFAALRAAGDSRLRRMSRSALPPGRNYLDLRALFRYDIFSRLQLLHRLLPQSPSREIRKIHQTLERRKSGRQAHVPLSFFNRKRPADAKSERPSAAIFEVRVPGTTRLPRWKLQIRTRVLRRLPSLNCIRRVSSGEGERVAWFDADAVGSARWRLRAWNPGDRFQPLGMSGTKKLQDFFVDRKVPRETRPRIPLIEAGSRIRWVVGLQTDDASKIVPGRTRRAIEFRVRPWEGA